MLYQKLIKLLNEKKFFEIEEIYQNNKIAVDKNEDLLTIYGSALFNQNKYESAFSVFRNAYSQRGMVEWELIINIFHRILKQ